MTQIQLDLAGPGRTVAENVAFALHAERKGWRGFWVAETTGLDAIATAGAVAARLQTGRVGTAIVPMQTRDPMLLAMAAASLGGLARGGFVLGLGTSTPLIIEDWHATPWGDSPLGLTRECVDLASRFLAGERITSETGRWRYRRAQLTTSRPERVPIYLAALGDRMLELAGEVADGAILNFVTTRDVAHAWERIRVGAERAGRSLDDFELMVFFRATVTESGDADSVAEELGERYQRELFTYVMAPVYQAMFAREGHLDACREVAARWRAGERQQALESIPPALVSERTLLGSAPEIRARLADYDAVGMTSAMVVPVAVPSRDYVTDCTRTIDALAPG